MDIFQIKKYSFSYPQAGQAVLKELSFQLEEGKFYVLCGRSGCGKSTLLCQFKTALSRRNIISWKTVGNDFTERTEQ